MDWEGYRGEREERGREEHKRQKTRYGAARDGRKVGEEGTGARGRREVVRIITPGEAKACVQDGQQGKEGEEQFA